MPASEVRVGKWSFDHIFVGQSAEFRAWTQGDRSATFAPVMLQFEDATSPMIQTELGEVRSVSARVLPTRSAVNAGRIEFKGTPAAPGSTAALTGRARGAPAFCDGGSRPKRLFTADVCVRFAGCATARRSCDRRVSRITY